MMKRSILYFFPILLLWIQCDSNDPDEPAVYDPSPYVLDFKDFPDPDFPADNRPTIQGVKLGRMLFYEKRLSKDGTQACADCHRQLDNFSDSLRLSLGVEKLEGKRQAMPVMNLAWHYNGMFWDGRSPLARDQALRPIQDALEMNETLERAIQKINADQKYRDQCVRAFNTDSITSDILGKAIEQFEFTMISNHSKFDRFKRNELALSPEEERGRILFFTEFDPSGMRKGAECFHCHGGFNFTNDEFMNNGLDSEFQQKDLGRQEVSKSHFDRAKFKVPSLRNIALSGPYMHDGRFRTLEEVVNFYNSGVKFSPTVDALMQYNLQPGGLRLNEQDKSDLIAFLKTLTDTSFVHNVSFSNPFK